MSNAYLVVLITAPSEEQGTRIARALVDERLCACVNVIGGCRSIYRWEGDVHEEEEVLLIAKTAEHKYTQLQDRVTELHPYDVPEIVAMAPSAISPAYERFLRDNLGE